MSFTKDAEMPMRSGMDRRSGEGQQSWSASDSALETRERQLALWSMILRARYAAIGLAALLAFSPSGGDHGFWVGLIALFLVIPYNGIYDLLMRRTGELSPVMAYSDQVLAVALIAFAPDIATPLLVVMLTIDATSSVSFGRRVAGQSAFVGAIGAGMIILIQEPPNAFETFLVYLAAGAFIVMVVGGVSEVERGLRWRYAELMSGIDAVVWEQVTRHPSTLYVNLGAEEILGYPPSAWRQPGFWGRTVHPDDRQEAARAYREAIRKGENRELEYRMIAADGRVVHVHDRMRVETDSQGRLLHVRGVLLDVTDRKKAESAPASTSTSSSASSSRCSCSTSRTPPTTRRSRSSPSTPKRRSSPARTPTRRSARASTRSYRCPTSICSSTTSPT